MDLTCHALPQHSQFIPNPILSCSFSSSSSTSFFFHSKSSSSLAFSSVVPFQSPKSLVAQKLQGRVVSVKGRELQRRRTLIGAINAAPDPENSTSDVADRWLLVPVGDGDSSHLGSKVELPDTFEIASNEVTVGRLPDKADIVIPVATVSGLHARITKKEENLLVTDLDSTNGTIIDEKRLRPGVVAAVSSGSCITFGDIHLAMFRVSKLKNVGDTAKKVEESENKSEAGEPTPDNTEI